MGYPDSRGYPGAAATYAVLHASIIGLCQRADDLLTVSRLVAPVATTNPPLLLKAPSPRGQG